MWPLRLSPQTARREQPPVHRRPSTWAPLPGAGPGRGHEQRAAGPAPGCGPAPGAPMAPRAPRPDADVSFPSHHTSRHRPLPAAPEVPPHPRPLTANQLFQRFLVLGPRFRTEGRSSEGRVPIGSSSGGLWELIGWRAVALWHACAASRTCGGGGGDRVSSGSPSPAVAAVIAQLAGAVHCRQQLDLRASPRLGSPSPKPTPALVAPARRPVALAALPSAHMASSAQSGGSSGGPAVPTVQRGIVKMVRAGPGSSRQAWTPLALPPDPPFPPSPASLLTHPSSCPHWTATESVSSDT